MSNINFTFVQDIISLHNKTKLVIIICYLNCLIALFSSITTPKGLNKINASLFGALSGIIGLSVSRIEETLSVKLNELDLMSRATSKELLSTLLKDNEFQVSIPTAPITEENIIQNPVDYWINEQKHLLLVGGTNDGKSTTVKLFISTIQNDFEIIAYDVDYAIGDYGDNVKVEYSYESIENAVNDDMEDLETRIGERRQLGKKYVPDKQFIIAEELPALVSELDNMGIWVRKLSKRGRKVGKFICACAQNDTAENLGLKGDVSIRDSNFVRLYLGKKAIARAKQLKNEVLQNWLEATKHGRALIDDKPCLIQVSNLLPASNTLPIQEEIVSASTSESVDGSSVLAVEVENLRAQNSDISEENKVKMARILKADGYSKTKIIKLIWGIDGGARFTELSKFIDS